MEKEPHIPPDDLAEQEKDLYSEDLKHMHHTLVLLLHEHRDQFIQNIPNQLLLKVEYNDEIFTLILRDEKTEEVKSTKEAIMGHKAVSTTNIQPRKSSASDMCNLYRDYSENGKKMEESWVVAGDGESVTNWVHVTSAEETGQIHKRPIGPATAEEVHRMAVYIDQIKIHLDTASST